MRFPLAVLVADDHPIVRERLSSAIEADQRLAVVAEAGDGVDALRLATELCPDAVVLDVEMPGLVGAEVMRGLQVARLATRVLIFTGHAEPAALRDVFRLRPDSLMRKSDGISGLCDEIVSMVSEESSVGRVRSEVAQAEAENGPALTDRERIVLTFAAEERSVAELADRLNVSMRTAKERRHDLCKRLGASSVLGAVATAIRQGLLD